MPSQCRRMNLRRSFALFFFICSPLSVDCSFDTLQVKELLNRCSLRILFSRVFQHCERFSLWGGFPLQSVFVVPCGFNDPVLFKKLVGFLSRQSQGPPKISCSQVELLPFTNELCCPKDIQAVNASDPFHGIVCLDCRLVAFNLNSRFIVTR